MKKKSFLNIIELVAMAAMFALLTGCGGGGGGSNIGSKGVDLPPAKPVNGSIQVKVDASAVAEATTVKITISGVDIQPIVATLAIDPATRLAERKVYVLAGASDRVIKAEALDSTGTVIATGQTNVKVIAGQSIKALITLNGNQAAITLQVGLPDVQITEVRLGTDDLLKGNISGDNTGKLGLIVYIKVGDKWYNRPFYDTFLTEISKNGNWDCNITPFLTDRAATEVLVFLVDPKTATIPIVAGGPRPEIPEAMSYFWYIKP